MRYAPLLSAAMLVLTAFAVPVAAAAVTHVNDNDPAFTYPSGVWEYKGGDPAKYQGDNHWTSQAGARAEFRFTGTKVVLRGPIAPHHGSAAISIDGGAPVTISQFSALRHENVAFFTSPALAAGAHVVTITVATGTIGLDAAEVGEQSAVLPRITVKGNKIQRGGSDWWFTGFNSAVWSGNCGPERMTPALVDGWFSSMRHDGHGAVRLFFFAGWDVGALDLAVASAKRHNVYLTITLDDALAGCGESSKTPEWYANPAEREAYRQHLVSLLQRYKGETAIAWFEYLNAPGGENTWRQVRDFYNAMGDVAATVDPDRLFSSGTVTPSHVGGETRYNAIASSRGVDVMAMHDHDEDDRISRHWDEVTDNAADKPVTVAEVTLRASENGEGCDRTFATRATRLADKLEGYLDENASGVFGWAWQPGGAACDTANLDADTASQASLRTASR